MRRSRRRRSSPPGVKIYPFKTIEAGAVVNQQRHLGVPRPAQPVRPARRLRHRQRRDHPRARGPAGQRVRHHAEEGRHGHHVPRRLPGRPGPQAGRHLRAELQRHQRARPRGRPRPGRAAGDRAGQRRRRPHPDDARAAGERRHRRSSTPPAPTCRRPRSASSSGSSPAGVPPRLPRRDRRPGLPAARGGGLRPRAAPPRRHLGRRGAPASRSSSTPAAARRRCVLPSLLGRPRRRRAHRQHRHRRGVADRDRASERQQALQRLGELVASSEAALRRALRPGGRAHLPRRRARAASSTTSGRCSSCSTWSPPSAGAAGRAAGHHHPGRRAGRRASTASRSPGRRPPPDDLARGGRRPDVDLRRRRPRRLRHPRVQHAVDGIAAFVRLVGLVARTQLTLSQIDARIPQQPRRLPRSVPTPWAAKGTVMRAVVEAAGDRELDTTDGVRVVERGRRWALVLPDPAEPVTHLWAEARRRPRPRRAAGATGPTSSSEPSPDAVRSARGRPTSATMTPMAAPARGRRATR